ncbi:diadenylate cyclase CdaA [bacterium]|nr:diadenylate cyclase CdaA [bacterium]
MELFKIGFFPIKLVDILDVFLVSLIFYALYLRIKDTRAMQLIFGLLVLLAAAVISNWAHFKALNALISFFGSVWLIGIVVIFAPDLRRLLIQIGQWHVVSAFYRPTGKQVLDEIVTAARVLSEKKFGAIMVITRETQLGTVVDTGRNLEAEVSYQLLVTIFTPGSPLHDLAVIIRGDHIVAANCLLPLSDSQEIDRALGSRHRAALGITEETDAVVVVVSEETREISIARDGKLIRNLSPAELRTNLISLLS